MCKINILPSKQFHKIEYKERNISVYFRGHVFIDNRVFENKSFLNNKIIINNLIRLDCDFIKNLDGNFAIIIKKNNQIALFVDRIRSIPLFYAEKKDELYISDKAEIINKKIKGKMDSVSFEEFKYTGYVTNENTLIEEIKQTEAGNYIKFNVSAKGIINRKTFKYFTYSPKPRRDKSKQQLLKKMDEVFTTTFQQLINFADGRKIVVPLSGGLDSRLIVYFLHKLNYTNVLCFSYGKPNNCESLISKSISERCNFDWEFVTYTRKMWRKFVRSNEGENYFKFASDLTSLAHSQDFMAIKSLINKKVISQDSIIVPGHSLDFIAGSHISNALFSADLSNRSILKTIIKKHYNLFSENKEMCDSKYYNKIKNKICYNIMDIYSSRDSIYGDYENWDFKERQAKYIVNSIRVYDYFSINWALPFYYYELLKFWKSVPYEFKFKRKLFKIYISNKFLFEESEPFSEQISKPILKPPILNKAKTYFYDKKEHLSVFFGEYYNHPLQWYGIFNNYMSYLKFSKPLFYKYVILENRFQSFYLQMNL